MRLVSKPISAQSFNLITAVRRDPSATKQYPSNNKDAFKYRDHRTQLPACFSYSAVISWGLDNGLCPVLSCVWCGGGSVQPGPSDVLRQQDVIEDPVREITACMEDVGDWRTNYRKCLMWSSSGTHSLLTKVKSVHLSGCTGFFNAQVKAKNTVTNIMCSSLTKEQPLTFIWTVQTSSVSSVGDFSVCLCQDDSVAASNEVLSVSIQT